jgi:hypothetical protein
MPVIRPAEQYTDVPYPLVDGITLTIGWKFRRPSKGGPAFVILRRSGWGTLKVMESFPLAEQGWASAWQSLTAQNPAAAANLLAALRAREADRAKPSSNELSALDARSLASLAIAALRADGWTSIASGLRWASRDYANPLSLLNLAT